MPASTSQRSRQFIWDVPVFPQSLDAGYMVDHSISIRMFIALWWTHSRSLSLRFCVVYRIARCKKRAIIKIEISRKRMKLRKFFNSIRVFKYFISFLLKRICVHWLRALFSLAHRRLARTLQMNLNGFTFLRENNAMAASAAPAALALNLRRTRAAVIHKEKTWKIGGRIYDTN